MIIMMFMNTPPKSKIVVIILLFSLSYKRFCIFSQILPDRKKINSEILSMCTFYLTHNSTQRVLSIFLYPILEHLKMRTCHSI